MGLVGQKRADILKFAIFVQNSVRNNKMLEVGVFCVKGEQNNNLTKYSHSLTEVCVERWSTLVNLPKLFCVVNNI